MRLNFRKSLIVLSLASFFLSSQNCSRVTRVSEAPTSIIHHSTANEFTLLHYTMTNLPEGSIEHSITLDLDFVKDEAKVVTVENSGQTCTKTFYVNPILTGAIQDSLQSMSYDIVESAPHLFLGDSFLTLTNSLGSKDFLLDAATIPEGVVKILDPANLFYQILGLLTADPHEGTYSCSALAAHSAEAPAADDSDDLIAL